MDVHTTIRTRCWHCHGKLAKAPGQPGLFQSTIWKDQGGNEVDVHKCCAETLKSASDPRWGSDPLTSPQPKFPENREPDHTRGVDGKITFKED